MIDTRLRTKRGEIIAQQGFKNIIAWLKEYRATKDERFLNAVKNAIGTLKRRNREDLLDMLVTRGVLAGYDIDDNLDEWPITVSKRERKLLGVE